MFNKKTIQGDIFGGINAAIVAIPVALAFGAATGMQPINGLYGAIALGFFAALIGGTPTLISNPTGPMAVVTAIIVAAEIEYFGNLEAAKPILMIIFFLAGAFQIVFGLLRLGKYVHYIPHPVISGFMSGIGVIIIISQMKSFFGVDTKYDIVSTLTHVHEYIYGANWVSVALGTITILLVYVVPNFTKKIPAPLVALTVVTLISYFFNLGDDYGVKLIGNIPNELPTINFGVFKDVQVSHLGHVVMPAISLAALGMIDTLLTSVVADKLTKTKHNSDRELFGQGLGNMISALIGGIPGAGTTPSTVLNINSGASTRLSGMMQAIFLLLVLVFGGPVASQIPYPALAGILISIGLKILDYDAARNFMKVPKTDNFVMLTVLFVTVVFDLLYAVGIGLTMAAFVFMKKMADVVEGESQDSKVDRLVEQLISTFSNAEDFKKQVYIKNLKGPMFFGFASRFIDNMEEIPKVKAVLINFSGVTYMDQSGMMTFLEVVERLKSKGLNVVISEVPDDILELIKGVKVVPDLIDEDHVFSSVEECIMWLNEPGHLDNVFAKNDELYIPSAYTPNGDGINDEWELKNIDKYPNCIVRIFNREGELRFESVGYYEMWEGMYKGRKLPSDTYHYEIDLYGDQKDVRKGKVSIFR